MHPPILSPLVMNKCMRMYIYASCQEHVVIDYIEDHAIVETPQNYLELEPWKLYFTDSSHKIGTGIRILVISPNTIMTEFKYKIDGSCSNNKAGYEDLINGLKICWI